MARKSAAVLKSAKLKISDRDAKFIKEAEKREVPEELRPEWDRYLLALREEADAEARVDALLAIVEEEGGSSAAPTYPAFQTALKAAQQASATVYGSLIHFLNREKHIGDAKLVDESELRAIVIDSISDKLDAVRFSINNGILGSKVAQSVRKLVQEVDPVMPPLCADCAA